MFLRGALIYGGGWRCGGGCCPGILDDGTKGGKGGWGERGSTDGDGAWKVGRHGEGVIGNGVWFLPGHVWNKGSHLQLRGEEDRIMKYLDTKGDVVLMSSRSTLRSCSTDCMKDVTCTAYVKQLNKLVHP